jgi:hypothetical protein
MRDQVARIQLDLDLVPSLARFYAPPDPGGRNRVANGVHRDISFHVYCALMQTIHFGNPCRQWFQMHAFECEELARHGADMFLVSRVDAVAPLPRLLIQIAPTGERAPGQKIVLDEEKRTFHARRAVGVADLVRYEAEPEAFPKHFHFRHGNHFASGSTQHHRMRVVDHDALRNAAHILKRIGEERLAIEPLKRRVDLEKQQARVTQHRRRGLRLILLATHFDCVWRRVVLHLHARLEVILPRRHDRCLSDALPAAERGQRRIRQRRAGRRQLLMDSHEIPLARCQEIEDLLPVGLGFLRPLDLRHAGGVRS